VQAGFEAGPPLSTPRIPAPLQSSASSKGEARPVLRAKTIATRVTPEELAEVEAAAEGAGKTVAEWLRELALRTARHRPADPVELLLAELMATRYVLLNLFHATALASAEGKQLLPDSIVKIRDHADAHKLEKARRLLQDFLSEEGPDGGKQ
jgi:Mobilization protein NikA